MTLVLQSTVEQAVQISARLLGLAILAGTLAAVAALVFRWFARDRLPRILAALVGLGGVAVYLNTTTALGQVIAASSDPTEIEIALFTLLAFLVGTAGSLGGRRAGDRFGSDVLVGAESAPPDDAGPLVRAVGRVIGVELPETIEDAVGYDPVAEAIKTDLAGKTFVFPRSLTVSELEDRLTARLKTDYGVGRVDLELAADGSIDHLAVGSRAAGISPTLPPATNAVAVRADPGFAASTGDLVQVWETDPTRRILTGELRGVAGDVVTLAVSARDTPKVDPRRTYRLVTLPVDDRPEREFASVLRATEETYSSVTVAAGSPLHGLPVGALDLTVISLEPEDGDPIVLPGRSHRLAPGDTVSALARPDQFRRLGVAGEPLDPELTRDVGRPALEPSDDGDAATAPEPEGADRPEPAAASTEADTPASADSFDQLKAEFESGEADWADSTTEAGEADTTDEVGHLEDAEVGFEDVEGLDLEDQKGEAQDTGESDPLFEGGEDTPGDDSFGDDDLFEDDDSADEAGEELGFDEVDGLDLDESAGGGLDTEDESEAHGDGDDGEETDEDDEDEEDDDDDDDGGGGGGGGASSFQQLKDEFESGEADWEDDVSDSPGGDMRLDE